MKLVKENINFERNKDPKDAMGTGSEQQIIEGLKHFKDLHSVSLQQNKNKTKMYLRIYDYSNDFLNTFDMINKYLLDFYFNIVTMKNGRILHVYIKSQYHELFQKIFDENKLYESLKFELNQDPKKAMKIGAWQHLRQGSVLESIVNDDELNWNRDMGKVYFEVVDIQRNVRIIGHKVPARYADMRIYTHMFLSQYDFEKATNYSELKFVGNYDQFERSFKIIKL